MAIIRSGWVLRPRTASAAFDFAIVSGCDQLVVGPTYARGRTLDLQMTDVPDLVRNAVVAPIGNSDHSSLSAVISMAQAVPNLCVSRKVFLKHQINWNTVCGALQDLPCVTFGFLTILLRFWTNICPCWLEILFVCATRISLGLMINAGVLLASGRRFNFFLPVVALGLTLSAVKWVLTKPTLRPSVSLVTALMHGTTNCGALLQTIVYCVP